MECGFVVGEMNTVDWVTYIFPPFRDVGVWAGEKHRSFVGESFFMRACCSGSGQWKDYP